MYSFSNYLHKEYVYVDLKIILDFFLCIFCNESGY